MWYRVLMCAASAELTRRVLAALTPPRAACVPTVSLRGRGLVLPVFTYDLAATKPYVACTRGPSLAACV
jgi:hypothetical protein